MLQLASHISHRDADEAYLAMQRLLGSEVLAPKSQFRFRALSSRGAMET